MIGAASGFAALLFYLKKRLYTLGTLLLAFLCAAEVAVIILSMTGSAGRRTNGIFDITMLAMILLAYTLSQTDRDCKHWNRVQSRPASKLDLRLKDPEDFFDTIQVGPKMAISQEYASAICRYISAMRVPAPLQIDLICPGPVAENLRDMMREVLRMHYEEEEDRIVKVLESRYRRILSLIIVSVFVVGIVRQTSVFSDEMILWEIIGNFAAFGLWQIGYTHYERNEAYDELLTVHIAKYASLSFFSGSAGPSPQIPRRRETTGSAEGIGGTSRED